MPKVFGLDRWIALPLFVIAAVYLYSVWSIPDTSFNDPIGPRAFPQMLAIAALALSLIMFLQPEPSDARAMSGGAAIGIATSVAATIGFVVLLPVIGFAACVFLVSVAFLISLREPLLRALLWAAALTAVFYVVFVTILNTSLPETVLGGLF